MSSKISNGTQREVAGKICVFYDGYWIKRYAPPHDTISGKKRLIAALTRRLFNHVEHGINMPGNRLNEARKAYGEEQDKDKKRVKGAMLAGALFNRAGDIFKKLVELQELGVEINQSDSLMRECGQCLLEALEFGKLVKHRSGEEGIDELWGEPFKAFSIPVEDFYESRYIKIAQSMRDIDHIAGSINKAFDGCVMFAAVSTSLQGFAVSAKLKCETLRTDPVIFDVWPEFVVAGETLSSIKPVFPENPTAKMKQGGIEGGRLIQDGVELITNIARARVSMPKSTEDYLNRCKQFSIDCEQWQKKAG